MTEPVITDEALAAAQREFAEQHPPRCGILVNQDPDDENGEDCGQRARWLLTFTCPHCNDIESVHVCDQCHDYIISHWHIELAWVAL